MQRISASDAKKMADDVHNYYFNLLFDKIKERANKGYYCLNSLEHLDEEFRDILYLTNKDIEILKELGYSVEIEDADNTFEILWF